MNRLLSPNRAVRIDAFRRLVVREQNNVGATEAEIAQMVGVSPSQLGRQLDKDNERHLAAADVVLLGNLLPEVRHEIASAWGERLVPIEPPKTNRSDVVNAAAAAALATTEAAAQVIAAAADGRITPFERASADKLLAAARRKLAEAESALHGMDAA